MLCGSDLSRMSALFAQTWRESWNPYLCASVYTSLQQLIRNQWQWVGREKAGKQARKEGSEGAFLLKKLFAKFGFFDCTNLLLF